MTNGYKTSIVMAAAALAFQSGSALASVVTTTQLDTNIVPRSGDAPSVSAPGATNVDDITIADTQGFGTSFGNAQASVSQDENGTISYINHSAAAGDGTTSRSSTLIRQTITNNSGAAQDVRIKPLVFGGGAALYIPDMLGDTCRDGRIVTCAASTRDFDGGGSLSIFAAGLRAEATVDFTIRVNGAEIFTFDLFAAFAENDNNGISLFTRSDDLNKFNGGEAFLNYDANTVLFSWQDTLLDIFAGTLGVGDTFDIEVESNVTSKSSDICLNDGQDSCMAAIATFSDPLGGGGIAGGGGFSALSQGLSPRSLPDPQVFFRAAGDPNAPEILQNPPGMQDVPAPGALALFGIAALGLGLMRRRAAV
ncbi:PEP-CTERM sorting domain-containing protein [Pacificimonas sp. WHA3]|uniref:PEP-CTERM sorting domain-containing protein n=1 Tax=Pacificimonas pallii TaxID=2827236 RepID=A0ABS6SCG1_9SPHN|nr:PEP-CTERM sorting domain-containing protein [Pacificimonas pallii]MBV7256108.1 PEP-CTERM sorting domain-containing protein [Pacificimonas pallii]